MKKELETIRNFDNVHPELPPISEMLEALTHYYEAAGFSDVGTRGLKNMSVDEIRKMYIYVFCKEEDLDESWRYSEEEMQ